MIATTGQGPSCPVDLARLTPRELQVAMAIGSGLSNRSAGRVLSMSPKTVECHVGRIYTKLDLSSRGHLVAAIGPILHPANDLSALAGLTAKELAVAAGAAGGLSNRQVARSMFVSPKTVEFYLSRVYAKLGIASRRQLPAVLGHMTDQVQAPVSV